MRGTLAKLVKKYGAKIHLVYRHLPLADIHAGAVGAAEASECAAAQGRFWPYHDLLFENAYSVDARSLQRYARRAAVPDLGRFQKCVSTRQTRALITADLASARELGFRGTPSFLIGRRVGGMIVGEPLTGAQSQAAFETVIERYLRAESR